MADMDNPVTVNLPAGWYEKARKSIETLDRIIAKSIDALWRQAKEEYGTNNKAGGCMDIKKNPRCNSEGYSDPTAFKALHPIIKADNALENKVNFLIKVLKFIATEAGFDIINRIELRDKQSGRVFR